jgi:TRAP-type C4-dicarboxylate transport system substrate-binding protein
VPAHFTGYDGGELGVSSTQATGKPGNAKELTVNVSLWPRVWAIVANPQALQRLSETQRATLRRAADEAIAVRLVKVRADELEAARALCSEGFPLVGASALEIARWRRAVKPVWREIRDDPSASNLLVAVAALAASVRPQSADPLPTCPRT